MNICAECKHCVGAIRRNPGCSHPMSVDGMNPVTGELQMHTCQYSRRAEITLFGLRIEKPGFCGPEGKYFEPKGRPAPPPPIKSLLPEASTGLPCPICKSPRQDTGHECPWPAPPRPPKIRVTDY